MPPGSFFHIFVIIHERKLYVKLNPFRSRALNLENSITGNGVLNLAKDILRARLKLERKNVSSYCAVVLLIWTKLRHR